MQIFMKLSILKDTRNTYSPLKLWVAVTNFPLGHANFWGWLFPVVFDSTSYANWLQKTGSTTNQWYNPIYIPRISNIWPKTGRDISVVSIEVATLWELQLNAMNDSTWLRVPVSHAPVGPSLVVLVLPPPVAILNGRDQQLNTNGWISMIFEAKLPDVSEVDIFGILMLIDCPFLTWDLISTLISCQAAQPHDATLNLSFTWWQPRKNS